MRFKSKLSCLWAMFAMLMVGLTLSALEPDVIHSATKFAASGITNDEVSTGSLWSPMVKAPAPATGEEWTLWVEFRKGNIQVKGLVNGAQKGMDWSWQKPEKSTWVRLGRYKRAQIADGFIITRGNANNGQPYIRSFALFTDNSKKPQSVAPATAPEAKATTSTATVSSGDICNVQLAGVDYAPNGTADGSATAKSDWSPVISVPAPKTGDAWSVWVEYKGGFLQAKGVVNGSQKQLDWSYKKPADYTWVKIGRYKREQMSDGLVIIRGNAGNGQPYVRKIALVTDNNVRPDTLPVFTAAQVDSNAPVNVAVDWDKKKAKIDSRNFGLNTFQGIIPAVAENETYQKNMKYMNCSFLRLHSANMMGSSGHAGYWLDDANKSWDREKITRAVQGLAKLDAQLVVNICKVPSWMKTEKGRLDPSEYDNFANLCAELAVIIKEAGVDATYYEITNEWDTSYWKANDLDNAAPEELGKLFLIAAKAMKKAVPGIKTGGPAVARADLISPLKRFCQVALPELDFISYHIYASGSAQDSNHKILYNRIDTINNTHKSYQNLKKSLNADHDIELFFNEYNISWTWDVRDVRMTNHVGAVFDALAIVAALNNEIDGSNAWNEYDGIYGKMGPSYTLRPASHLFYMLNKYIKGNVAPVTVDSKDVIAFAAQDGDAKTLFLINRSDNEKEVISEQLTQTPKEAYQLSVKGFAPLSVKPVRNITLPALSITLFTY